MPPSTHKHALICLPTRMLEDFEANSRIDLASSHIYNPVIETRRLEVLTKGASPEPPITLTSGSGDKAVSKSVLHFACITGDVPLAYEWIRLGHNINCRDDDGDTPLLSACRAFRNMVRLCEPERLALLAQAMMIQAEERDASVESAEHKQALVWINFDPLVGLPPRSCDAGPDRLWCATFLVMTLVLQHADVNVEVNGETPLSIICKTGYWPLIRLLVEHGADIHRHGPVDLRTLFPFVTQSISDDWSELIRDNTPAKPRPPLQCPCWSGKLLEQCHLANSQPYPAYFPCPCDKRRPYATCCRRKGMYFKDRWDDQTQRLVITWSPSPAHNVASMDGALLTTLKAFFLHLPNVKPHDSIFKSRLSKAWEIHQSALATKLLAQGRADPAFVHALKTAGRYYIHKEGSVPYMRRDVEKFVETWNAAIDYYITHGVDKRETYEIERNAKLGKNLGALIARCEADGCSAVESRSVRLLRCMKCQQILYCSKQCQRAHWRRHKAACLDIAAYQVSDLDAEESTAEKYVQLLPSQEMYELELMELQKESLRAISRMKTITQVFKRNPPMEAAGVIMALDSHALFESSRTLDGPRHTMVCIETPV